MDDLVQWLHKQLDEDERIARAATWHDDAGTWTAEASKYTSKRRREPRQFIIDSMDDGVITDVDAEASEPEGVARHIAEHDPARALREVDAKRRLLSDFAPMLAQADALIEGEWNSNDDLHGRLLAYLTLPYADRPGYREEWRP